MPRRHDIHSVFVAAAEDAEVLGRVTCFINSVLQGDRVV